MKKKSSQITYKDRIKVGQAFYIKQYERKIKLIKKLYIYIIVTENLTNSSQFKINIIYKYTIGFSFRFFCHFWFFKLLLAAN